MSTSERPPDVHAPTSAGAPSRPAVLSAEDQKELALLEASFQRIQRSVQPTPYILSTPSLDPYRHHSRQEEAAWMLGQRMWEPTEQHLQYRTFLFYDPAHRDCFVSQSGEDYGAEPKRPNSQPSNATPSVPKQKISLQEYKAKQANGAILSSSKKETPKVAPPKADSASSDKVKGTDPPSSVTAKPETSLPQKRPATEPLHPEVPEKRRKEESTSAPPPPEANPSVASPKESAEKKVPSDGTPHGLPPLLSPVDQAFNNPYGLPPILSPTLPSSVQAELDKMAEKRKRGNSEASSASSEVKNQLTTTHEQQSQRQKSPAASDARVPSDSVNGKASTDVLPQQETSGERSLIVKLRYGKYGNTIAQLLKLPPSRRVQSAAQKNGLPQDIPKEGSARSQAKSTEEPTSKKSVLPRKTARPAEPTTPAALPTGAVPKSAEKRPRGEDETSIDHPSKRPKPSQDGSRTPSRQVLSSPAVANRSSAQKSQNTQSTPVKEHKAVNMLRTASVESNDSTPGRPASTPANAKPTDPKVPLPASLSGKKQADSNLLSQISQKLNNKGRSLKHQAQNIFTEKGKRMTKNDQNLAAVTSLECILSYMAAYGAQDQWNILRGRPSDVKSTWMTLLPLCNSYAARTQDFPHLDGFRHYLCAVICSVSCSQVAPRASQYKTNESLEDMDHAELAKKFARLAEQSKLLSEKYIQLSREMLDARMKLPIEAIQSDYPKTWQGRERNAILAKIPEKFESGNLTGPYFLPIQSDTTSFQVVRFGLSFLKEYCENEDLDYNIRVNLETID